jgi:hypothetical protein
MVTPPHLRRGLYDARLSFVLACASSMKLRTDPLIEPARADELATEPTQPHHRQHFPESPPTDLTRADHASYGLSGTVAVGAHDYR